jgi:hypothetical protein
MMHKSHLIKYQEKNMRKNGEKTAFSRTDFLLSAENRKYALLISVIMQLV